MQRRPSGSGDAPPRLQKMKYGGGLCAGGFDGVCMCWSPRRSFHRLHREPSQGIGLIAVAVAGVAALWWWRKIATDDVEVLCL